MIPEKMIVYRPETYAAQDVDMRGAFLGTSDEYGIHSCKKW